MLMEKYRKTIKLRMALLGIMVLLAVGLSIFNVFFATEEMQNSYLFGFQSGAATGFGIFSLIMLIRYSKIIKDDNKLKLEYNKDNDERTKAIMAKAGLPMMLYTSVAMILAGIIVGYFNEVAFKTLVFAAMAQLIVAIISMAINKKIM